jgi:hypothetical protein
MSRTGEEVRPFVNISSSSCWSNQILICKDMLTKKRFLTNDSGIAVLPKWLISNLYKYVYLNNKKVAKQERRGEERSVFAFVKNCFKEREKKIKIVKDIKNVVVGVVLFESIKEKLL